MKQLTEAEMVRMVIDLVLGQKVVATTPTAAAMVKRLRRDLAALPPGAVIVIPARLV
jgi:hypothetical protein